jgi:uncharacterized protein YjbI with pentapeptide repeats
MIALFVALGGGATAGTVLLITGANVKNNSLTGAAVKNGSLKGSDVRNNSLTGVDIKKLGSADIRNRSLRAVDFKAGELPAGAVGPAGPFVVHAP